MHTNTNHEDWEHLTPKQRTDLAVLQEEAGKRIASLRVEFLQKYPALHVNWTLTIDAYPKAKSDLLGA